MQDKKEIMCRKGKEVDGRKAEEKLKVLRKGRRKVRGGTRIDGRVRKKKCTN
jgi:hypothetical protein